MVYPSHYAPGEYDLPDPSAEPRTTVAHSLAHFQRELQGRDATLIPWLQDFARPGVLAGRGAAQIDAAFAGGARGFLLWNAEGKYTAEATYRPSR